MLRISVLLAAVGCLFMLTAGSPSIGVIQSGGEFRVDGSPIRGNATLFDGSVVETTSAQSILTVGSVQVTLLPNSRLKVYRDHLEAATLQIASSGSSSALQVRTSGANHVAVVTRTGSVQVRSAAGLLVANVRPGDALSFDDSAGASVAVTLNGIIKERDGKYYLSDSTSNVTVEVRGTDLAKYVGKNVAITGSNIPGGAAPSGGASEVVQVVTIKPLAAGVATSGGAGIGLSRVAIIGGVATAATVGGLAAAGTFSSPSSVSNK